jgi:hypothetical protein
VAEGQTAGLLSCALANATALGLDDTQVAALARMYWGEVPPGGIMAAMVAVMSESQLRETVLRFAEALQQQAPHDAEATESAIAAAVERRIKDRAVVETELATAAAEKLLGWTKLFATFVAVPVGLLLLILSIFGISKFEDVTKVSAQVDALVMEARNKVDKLTEQLKSSQADLEGQVAQVKQITTSNENKIGQLTGNLQSVSTSVALNARGKSIVDLQSRLKELGFFQDEPNGNFGPSTVEAVKAFQAKYGLVADGFVGPATLALLFKP